MAITLSTVAKTNFGSVAGNVGMYTGANVDTLLADALQQIDAKLASAMHYKGTVADMDALEAVANPEVGDVYNVTASGDNYAWSGTAWDKLAGVIDLSAYKTDAQNELKYLQLKTAGTAASAGALATLDEVAEANLATALATKINGKVDAEAGKGLSTNDFTDALKTKLEGIAAGAEVNVQADWSVTDNSSDAFIKNKPTLGDLAAKSEVARTDLASGLEADLAAVESKADANAGLLADIAAVTAPSAMPTKDTVTLYSLYDAVDNIRTAVAAIITAAA